VLPCLPLLIAVRELRLKIIDDLLASEFNILEYDFTPRKLSEKEVDLMVNFVIRTGLKDFLQRLSTASIIDYVAGIEVGLDSNARKNRSGGIMEDLIESLIDEVKENLKITRIIRQKKFATLQKFGYHIPASLKNRKTDFILVKNKNKLINIETNFYSGPGSKPQEIVDSYINRQHELRKAGLYFIWITDGPGWKSCQNQLIRAIEEIDFILNINLAKNGFLEKIVRII